MAIIASPPLLAGLLPPSAFQISFFHSEYGAGGLNGDAAVAVAAGAGAVAERQSVTVDANLKFQN